MTKTLNKKDNVAWEQFNRDISWNLKRGISPPITSLGNCSVSITRLKDKLYLEIVPIESVATADGINGIIIVVDKRETDNVQYANMMDMAKQSRLVEKDKKDKKAILRYVY